jgi:hypothetical protein
MDALTGKAGKRQAEQAAAQQRRSLAELAKQQGEIDQAASTGKKARGRQLLTYLSGEGQGTLG